VWALALPVLFSALLWRRFAAQYRGEELRRNRGAALAVVRRIASKDGGADGLRLLSPQVAAVVRKEFCYLTRNGFALLALLMPPLLVLVLSTQFAGGTRPSLAMLSPQSVFPRVMPISS